MTPDQDAAMIAYFTEWADMLNDPNYQLSIGYTDTGRPTLDLHHQPGADGFLKTSPVIRWLLRDVIGDDR